MAFYTIIFLLLVVLVSKSGKLPNISTPWCHSCAGKDAFGGKNSKLWL